MHILYLHTKIFFVVFFMALSLELGSQNYIDIKGALSHSEYQKYQKAEKFISKGMLLVGTEDLTGVKMNRSKQRKHEVNMKKEQAYILLKDGYNLKLRVLSGYFEDYLKENNQLAESDKRKVTEIQSIISEGTNKSKKIYSKSRNTSKLSKSIDMQEDAQEVQLDAIIAAEEGLLLVQSFAKTPTTQPVAIVEDSLVTESVESKPVVEPEILAPVVVTAAVVAVVDEKKDEEIETVEEEPLEADVYFTIQVLADKRAATVTQQKMVYKGTRKVIENFGDGWYRYSVGRFSSYSEAASTMKAEGIKGYVVAYRGDERISTSEAKKILGGVK